MPLFTDLRLPLQDNPDPSTLEGSQLKNFFFFEEKILFLPVPLLEIKFHNRLPHRTSYEILLIKASRPRRECSGAGTAAPPALLPALCSPAGDSELNFFKYGFSSAVDNKRETEKRLR